MDSVTQASTNGSPAPTVLIVDDEPFIRVMLFDMFEEGGFSVLEASHSAQAIEILGEHTNSVDLLISDISMPGHPDGLGLASWVGEHRPAIKIILMSAYYEGQHLDAAHGYHCFVRKPFNPPHMFAVAETLLNRRRN